MQRPCDHAPGKRSFRRGRTASPLLIIFQSCPRMASAAAAKAEKSSAEAAAAPPLSVLFVFHRENYCSTQRRLKWKSNMRLDKYPKLEAETSTATPTPYSLPARQFPREGRRPITPATSSSKMGKHRWNFFIALKYLSALNQIGLFWIGIIYGHRLPVGMCLGTGNFIV